MRLALFLAIVLLSFSSCSYDEDLRIEKNDRFYRYFTNNLDMIGIMQRELYETGRMEPKTAVDVLNMREGGYVHDGGLPYYDVPNEY